MKFKPAYKCQLCGTVHLTGEAKEAPYDKLPELCRKVIKNQAPMYLACKCGNGDCGIAYFAGFVRCDA